MKKIIFITILFSHLALASEKIKIFTSNFPLFLLVNSLTKNSFDFEIQSIIPSSFDCGHEYVFTPKDAIKIKNANLVFIAGAGFDDFIKDKIFAVNNKIEISSLSDGLIRVGENPHIWFSFSYLEKIVEKMSLVLISKNTNSKDLINKNKNDFLTKLKALKNKHKDKIDKNIAYVSGHGVYSYVLKELNVNNLGSIYSYDEKPISVKEKVNLIKKIKNEKKVFILQDSVENESVINNFSKENSVKIIKFETLTGGKKPPEGNLEELLLLNIESNISRLYHN